MEVLQLVAANSSQEPLLTNAQSRYTLGWKQITQKNLPAILDAIEGHQQQQQGPAPLTLLLELNRIGDGGCSSLGKIQWGQLHHLSLRGNNISAQGCHFLSNAQWSGLHTLDLGMNHISDGGCKSIIRSPWSKVVSKLYLTSNGIGPKGCSHLSKGQWDHLQTLYLIENQIGDEGCRMLIKTEQKKLNYLSLCSGSIKQNGCATLAKRQSEALESLQLKGNPIGKEGNLYLTHCGAKVDCDQKYQKKEEQPAPPSE